MSTDVIGDLSRDDQGPLQRLFLDNPQSNSHHEEACRLQTRDIWIDDIKLLLHQTYQE